MAQKGASLKQIVRNTFIEFVGDDEDPWVMDLNCRRQQTDSFLDRRRLVRFEDEKSTDEGSNNRASSSDEEEGSVPSDKDGDLVRKADLRIPGLEEAPLSISTGRVATTHAEFYPQELRAAWGTETTVMIRNIPCKYTQAKLMREINGAGFLGRFDFLYVPMDPRSKANRGFAFCNFDVPDSARRFFDAYHGKKLRHFSSDKVIEVVPADIQGFEANAEHYMSARELGRVRNNSRPLFMRPLPSHLAAEEEDFAAPSRMPFSGAAAGMANGMMPYPGMVVGMPLNMSPSGPAFMPPFMPPSEGRTESVELSAPPASLGAPKEQTRFCPYCGKPKQNNSFAFCPYCGSEQPACP